ncbi:MAG: hypothetical protein QXU87_10650 [Candidatus Caldarchaeum sp.]
MNVLSNSYQVRAYNIKHGYEVSDFLETYRLMLQRAVDEIWARVRWVERFNRLGRRRVIPIIPKDGAFKNHYLRGLLMKDWAYSKHYVDSAIKQAYSIIKSWRRNYVRGERGGEKPTVKKRFVRIKKTLYRFRDGRITVSVKPYTEYLEFDISKAWFSNRVGAGLGELILGEKYLTVTFRFKEKEGDVKGRVAWDCNERSLDGFNPKLGWVTVCLTELLHIHRVYELKRGGCRRRHPRNPHSEGF